MKTPALLLIAVLTITSTVLAVDPPPDGGYPNENTAEGEDALFSSSVGQIDNTGLAYQALYSNPDNGGAKNTAVGSQAPAYTR